jgi:hypothetical protein
MDTTPTRWTPHPSDQAVLARIEQADHTTTPDPLTPDDIAAAMADRGWWMA